MRILFCCAVMVFIIVLPLKAVTPLEAYTKEHPGQYTDIVEEFSKIYPDIESAIYYLESDGSDIKFVEAMLATAEGFESRMTAATLYTYYMENDHANAEVVRNRLEKVRSFCAGEELVKAVFYESYIQGPFAESEIVYALVEEAEKFEDVGCRTRVYSAYIRCKHATSEQVHACFIQCYENTERSLYLSGMLGVFSAYLGSPHAQASWIALLLEEAAGYLQYNKVSICAAYMRGPHAENGKVKAFLAEAFDESDQSRLYAAYMHYAGAENKVIRQHLKAVGNFQSMFHHHHKCKVYAAYISSPHANPVLVKRILSKVEKSADLKHQVEIYATYLKTCRFDEKMRQEITQKLQSIVEECEKSVLWWESRASLGNGYNHCIRNLRQAKYVYQQYLKYMAAE